MSEARLAGPRVTEAAVRDAVAAVDDPEFPGVSIVDLGLLESIDVDGSCVLVELVPTFSGCPALDVIAADVRGAVGAVDGVDTVDVRFVAAPVWTPARVSPAARRALADRFTVAVELGDRPVRCPRCAGTTTEVSAFGPTRCRSVHRCSACDEIVEVVR